MAEIFAETVAIIRADSTQLRAELAASEKLVAQSSAKMAKSVGQFRQGVKIAEQGLYAFGGAATTNTLLAVQLGSQLTQVAAKTATFGPIVAKVAAVLSGPVGLVAGLVAGATAVSYFATQWLTGEYAVNKAAKAVDELNKKLREQQATMAKARMTSLRSGTTSALSEAASARDAAQKAFDSAASNRARLPGMTASGLGSETGAQYAKDIQTARDLIIATRNLEDAKKRYARAGQEILNTQAEQVRKEERLADLAWEQAEAAAARRREVEAANIEAFGNDARSYGEIQERIRQLKTPESVTGANFGIRGATVRGRTPVGAVLGEQREQQRTNKILEEIKALQKQALSIWQRTGIGSGVVIGE